MKTLSCLLVCCVAVNGNVFLHNPRGSNNRNCERTTTVQEPHRLFNSQNDVTGGYSCPRAVPFACYQFFDDKEALSKCNSQNDKNTEPFDPNTGELKSVNATATERMYYYSGSILPIQWTTDLPSTDSHHSQIIIQVACENTMSDVCTTGNNCSPRDGIPVNNYDAATDIIPMSVANQSNFRYGRHETLSYYHKCQERMRNKGLFTADLNLNGNDARFTRQNYNGTRYGFECPEESNYYPYWHDSPWIDVAIVTSDLLQCPYYKSESQNVKEKGECICGSTCSATAPLPNNVFDCEVHGGVWENAYSHSERFDSLDIKAPECLLEETTRMENGEHQYNWVVPKWLEGQKSCVLRIRYNVTSDDGDGVARFGTSKMNGLKSPIKDTKKGKNSSWTSISNLSNMNHASLSTITLASTIGRTFQDRSYVFSVKAPKSNCNVIHNLNVRGKRGSSAQVFPSVQYGFVPKNLIVNQTDCIHIQWTGSDYNPASKTYHSFGGPPNPLKLGQVVSDRSNFVQIEGANENTMIDNVKEFDIFGKGKRKLYERLAFIDQPIDDHSKCKDFDDLEQLYIRHPKRLDYSHLNCATLGGALTPYFDGGLVKLGNVGVYYYMSTRNNLFGYQTQKGSINVQSATASIHSSSSDPNFPDPTFRWTNWFSEENGFSDSGLDPVRAIRCEGRNCNNKRLQVVTSGFVRTLPRHYWTQKFSQESSSNHAMCPYDYLVTQIACEGRNCDHMRLRCSRLWKHASMESERTHTSDWFSSIGNPFRECPANYYLVGIECKGFLCNSLRMTCMEIIKSRENIQ